MLILQVCKALNKYKVPYAIVGGHAVALHGAVRGTMDLDMVIEHKKKIFINTEAALNEIGFVARLPVSAEEVFNFREEYIKNRNLIAWSFYKTDNPTAIVDIIITHDFAKQSSIKKKILDTQVSVLDIDDLIKMKTKTGRPQDEADVTALRKLK
jgi:hypothetical protein